MSPAKILMKSVFNKNCGQVGEDEAEDGGHTEQRLLPIPSIFQTEEQPIRSSKKKGFEELDEENCSIYRAQTVAVTVGRE